MENLKIANRDPEKYEKCGFQYWLNYSSKELFEWNIEWMSLTKQYIENNQPDIM